MRTIPGYCPNCRQPLLEGRCACFNLKPFRPLADGAPVTFHPFESIADASLCGYCGCEQSDPIHISGHSQPEAAPVSLGGSGAADLLATPRVDALARDSWGPEAELVPADDAREIERELNEAESVNKTLHELMVTAEKRGGAKAQEEIAELKREIQQLTIKLTDSHHE